MKAGGSSNSRGKLWFGPGCLKAFKKTRRAAVMFFEIARKVGELFVAQVECNAFYAFAGGEFLVGDFHAITAQPLAERATVGFFEMPLHGPSGNAAESSHVKA